MSISIILLIGIPGAGKTTLVTNISNEFKTKYNCLSITYDKYLKDFSEYREIRYRLFLAIENLVLHLQGDKIDRANFLLKDLDIPENNLPYIILIDDNMHYRSMRYRFYQMSQRRGISFGQIYLKCDLNVALNQNLQRPLRSQITPEIITKMFNSIELPNPDKFKWEKYSFKYNNFDEIENFIMEVIKNPIQPKNLDDTNSNNLPNESTLHTIDLHLRKRVNLEIKNLVIKDPKKIDEITKYKNMLLINIKKGNISIDLDKIEESINDLFTRFC